MQGSESQCKNFKLDPNSKEEPVKGVKYKLIRDRLFDLVNILSRCALN